MWLSVVLPFAKIQNAPDDRISSETAKVIFPAAPEPGIMAVAIMVSTFGCYNGLILAGARAYYAIAQEDFSFGAAAEFEPCTLYRRLGSKESGLHSSVLPRMIETVIGKGAELRQSLRKLARLRNLCGANFYILTIAASFCFAGNVLMPNVHIKRSDIRLFPFFISLAQLQFFSFFSSIKPQPPGPG